MQLSDGGWGWFSGFGEQSWPHTTAVVVHGLQVAKQNDVALVPGMLERGIDWLKHYQEHQVELLKNALVKPKPKEPYKTAADNLDAFVYMVLVDGGVDNVEMRDFLYRDRVQLTVYAKALLGLALEKQGQKEKLSMILKNIEQFVVQDNENQTAYLKLPEDNWWWTWYGSEIEADAYFLKLLTRTDPKGAVAPRIVKYLLNNRKHASYWNSTRDTSLAIEALAEFLKASGEDKPNLAVEIWLDGQKQKEVKIAPEDLFTFDNKFVLHGDAVTTGKHDIEIKKKGSGPLYYNAYLTLFSLEDYIPKAGLEVKVIRKTYKLIRDDKTVAVAGSRGQAVGQRVEKYRREELKDLATLKSGDLVEVELEIDSKNDYEYLIFEDMKAAGFEPVEVRSGYGGNAMGAYMELRDNRASFFIRTLARGKHSVAYRLRAEIPGRFSALPARASAMYAPELKGNSDEIKLHITD
jgi:alpha-2-macroglobulin